MTSQSKIHHLTAQAAGTETPIRKWRLGYDEKGVVKVACFEVIWGEWEPVLDVIADLERAKETRAEAWQAHATAAQRCEAFGLTLGLWKPETKENKL